MPVWVLCWYRIFCSRPETAGDVTGGLNPSETRWKEQPVGKAKERKEEDLKGA